MPNYKFLKKKAFEKIEKFEKRVNDMAMQGWKVINFTREHGEIVVLFERDRQ